jgi:HD-GYP domain-containing protein (c-di-GMP phosphodiesterase class II)
LTNSDGASVYTVEKDGRLYFRVWQNTSTGNGQNDQAVPVSKNSIASFVAKTGELLVIDDAYRIAPDKPYRFLSDFDSRSNYVTRSLLTVPLTNKAEEVVGVLQLINRKRDSDVCLKSKADVDSQVLPFDQSSEQVALALAGQAGVALENARLHKDIENVFEGFVNASVTAIESRDPSTAGHSFRVAALTEKLAIMADRTDRYGLKKTHFTREQLKELRYAALLHDFGKVGVREHVLLKAKKLYPRQLELIQQRFRLARLSVREAGYRQLVNLQREKQFDHDSFETQYRQLQVRIRQELAQLDSYMQLILQANEPSVLDSEASAELQKLHAVRFMDDQEQSLPLIEPYEFDSLSLSRGSLRPEERQEIESHVSHTYAFLKLIPWTRDFAALPDIAHAHHEKMDGTGYPRGLTAEEIPVQSRMMTIADIYDALTAADRPYKQAVPVERALTILQSEADAGKLDPDLLALFLDARVYAAADD